jgi:AcrR family transcriptional regulator
MYRQLVFDSAEHLFAQKGFEDTTMQEIAAEAGISLKTLYATVPGKTELYDEVLAVRGQQFVEETSRGLEGGGSALQALSRGVRAYVHFLVDHEDFLRIHLREGHSWVLPLAGAGEREREKGESLFASVVALGIEQGLFYPGDPQRIARTGMAVMQAHLERVAEGIHDVASEELADEILTNLRRLLCRPEVLADQALLDSA